MPLDYDIITINEKDKPGWIHAREKWSGVLFISKNIHKNVVDQKQHVALLFFGSHSILCCLLQHDYISIITFF